MSNFELRVTKILQKSGIKFIQEKTFSQLRGGHLRFDFYLPDKNICIECDGAQHFTQIKHFYASREQFLLQKENDRRKNSFCLANNIPLYRVPFWQEKDLKSFSDIIKPENLVTTKWHNDLLDVPKSK